MVVLIPGQNNHIVAGLSSEERLGTLLERGVRVFRWRGPMIHSKSVVVGGAWAFVGSSNLDALSLERNAEINVEIHGTAPAERLAELFREDCAISDRFTPTDWRSRRPLRKLAVKLASRLATWQ